MSLNFTNCSQSANYTPLVSAVIGSQISGNCKKMYLNHLPVRRKHGETNILKAGEHPLSSIAKHLLNSTFNNISSNLKANITLLKKNSIEIIRHNPIILVALVKAATGTVTQTTLIPLESTINKHILKKTPLIVSFKETLANPYAGAKQKGVGTAINYSTVFLTQPQYAKALKCIGFESENAEQLAYLPSGMSAAVARNYAEQASLRMQVGLKPIITKSFTDIRPYLRGAMPGAAKAGTVWFLGMSAASKLQKIRGPNTENTTLSEIATQSCGWVFSNFVASPFFQIQKMVHRSDLPSIRAVLISEKILYDPSQYQAEHYTVPSKIKRFVLGLPTDTFAQPYIKPEQRATLTGLHLLENAPKFWRGFVPATPVIILSGCIVGIACQAAKEVNKSFEDK